MKTIQFTTPSTPSPFADIARHSLIVVILYLGTVPHATSNEVFKIHIANKDFDAIFEDDIVIENKEKGDIISDINLNIAHIQSIEFRQSSNLIDRGYTTHITHWFDEGDEKRMFADPVEHFFGGAIKKENDYIFVINHKLVNSYLQSIELKNIKPELFSELYSFINTLNDSNKIEAIAAQLDTSQEFFYFLDTPPINYDFSSELKGFTHMDTRYPSLLDIKPMQINGEETLSFTTMIQSRDTSSEKFTIKGFPTFIYESNRWKIYIPPPL